LGDKAANHLRSILGRGNHSVQAVLGEARLCNKSCHVILLDYATLSAQIAEVRGAFWPPWPDSAARIPYCRRMIRLRSFATRRTSDVRSLGFEA
jgi:hypothetical protein